MVGGDSLWLTLTDVYWQWEQYQVPIANLEPSIGTILPIMNLQWLTKDTMEKQTSGHEPMEASIVI